jgi:hypothetical protein
LMGSFLLRGLDSSLRLLSSDSSPWDTFLESSPGCPYRRALFMLVRLRQPDASSSTYACRASAVHRAGN